MAHTLKPYQGRSVDKLAKVLDKARLEGVAGAFEQVVEEGLPSDYKPMPGLPDVPYACLRIPTGGGKTIMGANIIHAARGFLDKEFPLVLWMVPTTQIKTQTLEAFQDRAHPYRQQLDDTFNGQVSVYDIADITQIRPADLGTKVCIVLTTLAALRVEEREGRKVYEDNENLDDHFAGEAGQVEGLERDPAGKAIHSFANVCRLHRPLVIMDEAHNATTPLSYTVYERLAPKAVVELTATPDTSSSNILVSVSAFELKFADMIKFPVILKEHLGEWQTAVSAAVARRKTLAKVAMGELDYIRPILLIQAENKNAKATVAQVKKHLLDVDKVAEKAVAVATGDTRELDGVDLFAKDCSIEVIITKQALKEGWDCSFAYVFCSVAQVKSEKDIQQLLGRVLRMPYATPRKQPAMSRAYAHVITEDFGKAAGELTQALVDMGFNPTEAAAALRKDTGNTKPLPLAGGAMAPPQTPTTTITVDKEPDLADAPARDAERVVYKPNADGNGGTLEITGEVDEATVAAIAKAVGRDQRDTTKATLAFHNHTAVAANAPSERGAEFVVPRLYIREQGELELVQKGAVGADFTWDLLAEPADLASFAFHEESKTFEVFLEGKAVQYHLIKDDAATYLPGFAQDRTATDLIGWLGQNVISLKVRAQVKQEWIRRAIDGLMEERGFSLAQLLRGQFVLQRKLTEELDAARSRAYEQGFQRHLFGEGVDAVAPMGSDHGYTYPADMTAYPARFYYDNGTYKFRKHYYPQVGDLRWKTPGGTITEEFLCAQVIDTIDEVEFWVRNLVHSSQFWMPTHKDRTYPDFVAKLNDGRLFVIEYKGGDRISNDDSKEKRLVGELWEQSSNGKGLYAMVQIIGGKADSIREQLLSKIRS